MFETLSDRLESVFTSLRGRGRLSDSDINATCREIRVALLEADVALPVVKDFIAAVRERARGAEVSRALNPAQQVVKIVNEELVAILGGEERRLRFAKSPPTVVMLAGLQGSGKTTLAGKLGLWLREQGHAPLLVAADLQRPNAVQQLQIVAERASVGVYAPEPGSVGTAAGSAAGSAADAATRSVGDPIAVARDSIDHARRMQHDIVVIDTAGRLGVDAEMMRQAADIRDAVDPDEILFVVDAMIGQDAVATAEAFLEGVGFDGVALTKLDGDARGGAALSVARVTGRQIMFASTGEKLADFDLFHPDRMASRILGMGDVLTLIEQAEKTFDADQTAKMADKLVGGDAFTLEDFLEQMAAIRRMGPLSNVLGMMPGMGQLRGQIEDIDDRDLDRVAAIIQSMTAEERRNPKVLNASRRSRIARGSGTTVTEVNGLVDRFFEAQKMMKQFAGGMGVPGMSGTRRKATKPPKGKGKKKAKKAKARQAKRKSGAGVDGQSGELPADLPGQLPSGVPGGLPPGLQVPDLSKLDLPRRRDTR
ncbi:MAG: signal recognition particle protein [Streptosporangiaceae bacterium]